MSDQGSPIKREGLIEAAFRLTQERLGPVSALGILDEEAVTAFLLGGVAVSATLLREAHGENFASQSAAWGSYTKSGGVRDPRSETATGGDFALVIWVSKEEARLAIFQAKKGAAAKNDGVWTMDIRRGPSETSFPNTQFVMLFANALLY